MARYVVLFDWTDACVAHPFLDVVHLGGAPLPDLAGPDPGSAWVRAYLDRWREGYDDAVLTRALGLATVVERAFQAVSYEGIQRSLEPDARRDLDGVQARILGSVVALAERAAARGQARGTI